MKKILIKNQLYYYNQFLFSMISHCNSSKVATVYSCFEDSRIATGLSFKSQVNNELFLSLKTQNKLVDFLSTRMSKMSKEEMKVELLNLKDFWSLSLLLTTYCEQGLCKEPRFMKKVCSDVYEKSKNLKLKEKMADYILNVMYPEVV